MSAAESADLAKSAAAGDDAAFDLLMERYRSSVFRLALRMLGNREDAEDVQQEAFVRAYCKLHTFRGDASFGRWLHTITARLCISWGRRATRRRVEARAEVEDLDGDPQQRLAAVDAAARIQETLAELLPSDRLLIVLKHIEGLSHAEIAGVLGCSVESSRSRLTRARRLFRERYEERE